MTQNAIENLSHVVTFLIWRNQCIIFRMYVICSEHFFIFLFYHAFSIDLKKRGLALLVVFAFESYVNNIL
jgi:hypothetical protein